MSSAAMAAVFPHAPPLHDLEQSSSYAPLPDQPEPFSSQRRPIKTLILSVLFLFVLVALILNQSPEPRDSANVRRQDPSVLPENLEPASRGVEQGVSEKAFRDFAGERDIYPWTNAMLSWQRTSYHFQPEKKWMNDPNGPLFHMGWYHLFYQYNPDSAMWDKITWGHAVSRDLIHWLYLPLSMVPDKWYDINGVWTGSATILPDGRIVMLYTGDTEDLVQVQNLAYPANLSDPLLLDWEKYPGNPILVPPLGIGSTDFRDPTTGLIGPDGKWRVLIGSKINKTGISLVYKTENFTSYDLVEEVLHEVPGTGMWECIDFYPVLLSGSNGLDTSTNGPDTKHVLKASLDDNRHDYYAIGSYDPIKEKWTPDNPKLDVGIGLRVDYGKYYASKTFYDHNKKRRVLWGWIGETDSESADLLKGWSSVQTIPRTVVFDVKTGANILQWPVSEVESLRSGKTEFNSVEVAPGSIIPLHLGWASQLDVEATFEVDEEDLAAAVEADVGYDCVTSGGSQKRGSLGPFGLLVLADEKLSEMTPVYFYITRGANGSDQTYFCSDETRSSTAPDVGKLVYGSSVPVLEGEKLSMRLLVDHSIVESFAQGGRRVITLRVYPTRAIYGSARLFLFNNATAVKVKASVKAWQVDSADIHPFPLDYPSF